MIVQRWTEKRTLALAHISMVTGPIVLTAGGNPSSAQVTSTDWPAVHTVPWTGRVGYMLADASCTAPKSRESRARKGVVRATCIMVAQVSRKECVVE